MGFVTKIVKIGNSQGIRIPKALLEQVNLVEATEVELVVKDDQLVVRPIGNPRTGWEGAFARMAEKGDDALLDVDMIEQDWDVRDWEW